MFLCIFRVTGCVGTELAGVAFLSYVLCADVFLESGLVFAGVRTVITAVDVVRVALHMSSVPPCTKQNMTIYNSG